ncbi:MAG: YdeI/OmpD-associated family protein [Clostridiales bacterium]|jgi:uncharacterized protein YdhG (YjbR/CyaY superfamily)|nr:YdeI/OmpD-associated family protein [Clostridiales bacterium]
MRKGTGNMKEKVCEYADYIAAQDEETWARLEAIDKTVKGLSNRITVKISWSMPTYVLRGVILQVCAFKRHIGLYPGAEAVEAFKERLGREGYAYSKGGVRLPLDRALPLALIEDVARFTVAADGRETNAERRAPAPWAEKPLPDGLRSRLAAEGLTEAYRLRPRYQRAEYISWIERAVRSETKERREAQMIDELRGGGAYMGRAYKARVNN